MNETVNLDACAEIAQNLETCLDEGQNAAFQIYEHRTYLEGRQKKS